MAKHAHLRPLLSRALVELRAEPLGCVSAASWRLVTRGDRRAALRATYCVTHPLPGEPFSLRPGPEV